MIHIWIVIILLHADICILISNDASTKIRSQNIYIADINGYTFNTGTPISAYTVDSDQLYALIVKTNLIKIMNMGFGFGAVGNVIVYYI